ncbi:alpha/beta hydrolase [Frankia nepalensis]|uniref:Alpha/beta hydrolase n=1 Tax=Frankia nepalensis TaxID=1836974 RepID=A0A937ULI2_9ACTN|nr:alpha/beta hydrolase [Frankia nepalensis]MBL7500556.1 alpha/beta hydrolase [Frankia nepalensis]MBL7509750.1 alpha/beta hydrolase [Frankia nepalensis]MBL7627869.1 alpha/beta hydrolase [Frankia nepalensis]
MAVLNVERYGDPDGPPLLAIHGITGHARRWERLAGEGWPARRTLAVDLRGHGFSPWEPPWSLDQLVDDVLDTLDALGAPTVDLVGHSYGGAVGLRLLARAPDRLRRLVLLDPGLARPSALMAAEAEALLGNDGWADLEAAIVARSAGWLKSSPDSSALAGALRVGASAPGDGVHPAIRTEIDHHLFEGADGRYRFRFSRPAVIAGFGELCRPVPEIPVARPTLVVVAGQAGVVTPGVLAQLRRQLGDQLLVTTLDCGHMVAWERFEDTVCLVETFLTRPGPVGPAGSPRPAASPDPDRP